MYSTLALGKEREIVKEETALRKEKEAVCCSCTCYYPQVHVYTSPVKLYSLWTVVSPEDANTCTSTGPAIIEATAIRIDSWSNSLSAVALRGSGLCRLWSSSGSRGPHNRVVIRCTV